MAVAKFAQMKIPKQKQYLKEHDPSEKNLEVKKVQQQLKNQISGLKKIQKASSIKNK